MKSYKELQGHVETIIEESKPVNDVSKSGKKLVSAFDVINHANKLAKAEGSYHDARKTKLKVTREHLQRARSELLGEAKNEEDVIKMDVPTAIRALEKSKEDIESDDDLHKFATKLVKKSKDGKVLTVDDIKESGQLDELSIDTLKSYSAKARESSAQLVKQGVKAKKPETSYAKLKKATKRLDSAHTADKKVFKKEWNAKVGITEELDVNNAEAVPYKELIKKFQKPQDKEVMDMPHGHTLNPTSETHRKQLIRKLKDD